MSATAHFSRRNVEKLAQADMLPDLSYMPAGVTQLMKRQQQGWAYIRP